MHGAFDDEEFEPAEPRRDTVLTLGPLMGAGLFVGLALLCGVFFGLGYAVGHRTAPPAAVTPEAADKLKQPVADSSRTKPAATGQNNGGKSQANSANRPPATPQPVGQYAPAQAEYTHHPADAAAHPAAPVQQPQQAGPLMVQVAAVSHQEDAEVLQGALRKRGYPVALSRDAADNLIHVRIGPFSSRDEAARWRQKLLNDGYNAMLQ